MGNAHESNHNNSFENYTFQIISSSPRRQWVKLLSDSSPCVRYCQDYRKQHLYLTSQAFKNSYDDGFTIPIMISHLLDALEYKKMIVSFIQSVFKASLMTRFMGPTWGPSGADRTQVGPMLTPWTLLSGMVMVSHDAIVNWGFISL